MKKIFFLLFTFSIVSLNANNLQKLNPKTTDFTARWLRKSCDRLSNIENIEKDAEVYQTVLEEDSIQSRLLQARANILGIWSIPSFACYLLMCSPLSRYPHEFENDLQPYLYGGTWLVYASLASYFLYRFNRCINQDVELNGKITDALEEIKQAHMLKK